MKVGFLMRYVYPAIIYPDNGKTGVTFPDLPGCHTYDDNLPDALLAAKDALEMWLYVAESKQQEIPPPSNTLETSANETVNLIVADTDEYRRANDTRAVKKTVSIPAWLNTQAEKANAPFSQILQEGLKAYLHIEQ